MLIWRGYGWLTLVFVVLMVASFGVSAQLLGHNGKYLAFVFAIAFIIGNAMVGRRFNRALEALGLPFYKRHSLFWIPMEWWSAAYAVLLIFFTVAELFK